MAEETQQQQQQQAPPPDGQQNQQQQQNRQEPARQEPPDEETAEALRLYKALNNPKSANAVLEALADQVGMELKSKSDVKEVKKDIISVLKSKMPGYEFLAAQIGPALEEILNDKFKEVDNKFKQSSEATAEAEADEAIEDFQKQHEDFKLFEPRIAELMDEIKIGPKTKFITYLNRLYSLAKLEAQEKEEKGDKKKTQPNPLSDRLQRNRQDAAGRVPSSGGEHKARLSDRPKLRDAISATLDELENE